MPDKVRLQKELKDILAGSADSGVSAEVVGDDLSHWKGTLKGPEGTPYEGGIFTVDIRLDDDYPYNPPKMKFDTKVWHPNVSSQTGAICLDILKKEWSPALTIRTTLHSLQALLCAPEPDDPQDAEVANQFKNKPEEFKTTAAYWTQAYAKPQEEDAAVAGLTEMGFDAESASAALKQAGGDQARALEILLGGA